MSRVTIRSLIKETAIYGISGVLARSLGLLLLPVLSNLLPLDQFGHYKLTYVLIGLLQLFLVFGMGNSLVRYLIGAENEASVFSSHFWPLFAVTTAGCLAIFLGADSLASAYFAQALPGDAVMIRLAAVVVWFDSINTLPYSLLRAKNRPLVYTAAILFSAAVYAGLVIYLLGKKDYGMTGVLIANAAGSGAVFLCFVPVLMRYLRPVFSRELFGLYFAFGFPIIFSSLGKNLLDLADRWILDRLLGAATVAYYSAGYQLAAVANLAVAAFTLAWKPFLVRAAAEKDSDRTFSRIMTLSVAALLTLFLAVSFFADDLVGMSFFGYHLIKESYWPGLAVIPPVMISYVFYGIYVNLTVGCDLSGRTQFYAWTTGVAAAFNIAANFLLIPHLGMMGSAWATLAAYVLQAVLLYILTRRIYPVSYRWGRITLAFGVALAIYAAAGVIDKYASEVFGSSAEVLIEGGLLAVWCLFLLASRIVRPARTAGDRSRNDGSAA